MLDAASSEFNMMQLMSWTTERLSHRTSRLSSAQQFFDPILRALAFETPGQMALIIQSKYAVASREGILLPGLDSCRAYYGASRKRNP